MLYVLATILAWRPGGGSPRPVLYSTGFLLLASAQVVLGIAHVASLHVPLGVLMFALSTLALVRALSPARRCGRPPVRSRPRRRGPRRTRLAGTTCTPPGTTRITVSVASEARAGASPPRKARALSRAPATDVVERRLAVTLVLSIWSPGARRCPAVCLGRVPRLRPVNPACSRTCHCSRAIISPPNRRKSVMAGVDIRQWCGYGFSRSQRDGRARQRRTAGQQYPQVQFARRCGGGVSKPGWLQDGDGTDDRTGWPAVIRGRQYRSGSTQQ